MNDSAKAQKPVAGTLLPLLFFTTFFIVNGVLGYFAISNVAAAQDQVNASRLTINLLHELHLEILRAETGQRGYLLTNLDTYATPYREAMSAIDTRLSNMAQATMDAAQQERFVRLQGLIGEKLNEMSRSVDLLSNNLDGDAIQALLTHRGLGLMQEITLLSQEMEQHERALLDEHLMHARDSRGAAFFLILTANLVGLVMVFVTAMLVRSHLRKEREYRDNLQAAKDTLEQRVEERTAVLQHYSNELKRSNRELQDFAFVASHDLQEPLRKIRAFGDRLQQKFAEPLGDQGRDYIKRMQSASTRMSALIEDLLSFSRITTKAKPFLPVALDKVVAEVLEDLEVAIDECDASIDCDPLPTIDADQFQMKQLFQNLIGNALKFRKPDVAPAITIRVEQQDGDATQTLIRVSDNGIGFDQSFAERIFMPFQRLHGKNEYSGTGIGLAICRRIVERHGGTLDANSHPDAGSVFTVALPLQNQSFEVEENA